MWNVETTPYISLSTVIPCTNYLHFVCRVVPCDLILSLHCLLTCLSWTCNEMFRKYFIVNFDRCICTIYSILYVYFLLEYIFSETPSLVTFVLDHRGIYHKQAKGCTQILLTRNTEQQMLCK